MTDSSTATSLKMPSNLSFSTAKICTNMHNGLIIHYISCVMCSITALYICQLIMLS